MLEGGTGDDTYIVYAATDQVIENPGEGTDTVRSSLSFTLGEDLENLTLTGTAATQWHGQRAGQRHHRQFGRERDHRRRRRDTLVGGGGGDMLTGGAGADRFKFTATSDSAPGAADVITDFSGKRAAAQGDKIDLSAIDANSNTAANDAFSLVNKFSGQAGQAYSSYDKQSGTTSIYLDVDGDRSPDMVILLLGHVNLTTSDFIL